MYLYTTLYCNKLDYQNATSLVGMDRIVLRESEWSKVDLVSSLLVFFILFAGRQSILSNIHNILFSFWEFLMLLECHIVSLRYFPPKQISGIITWYINYLADNIFIIVTADCLWTNGVHLSAFSIPRSGVGVEGTILSYTNNNRIWIFFSLLTTIFTSATSITVTTFERDFKWT